MNDDNDKNSTVFVKMTKMTTKLSKFSSTRQKLQQTCEWWQRQKTKTLSICMAIDWRLRNNGRC